MYILRRILPLLLLVLTLVSMVQSDIPAYRFFTEKGKATDFEGLVKKASKADVIFFGELHNNAICHWLQLRLTKELYKESGGKLILGAEMFEADDKLVLDEYLGGRIKTTHFENESKIWNNYKTDYSPLVEFAKAEKLPFVATNIPRRYASVVAREGLNGLETLSEEAKKFIAPLPIEVDYELPGYKNMIDMMKGGQPGHGADPKNFAAAQAVKDATMAHFISENFEKGHKFLHYNGTYHSNNFEGIVWYLKRYAPKLKVLTISTVLQEDLAELEKNNTGLADFILCSPADMAVSY